MIHLSNEIHVCNRCISCYFRSSSLYTHWGNLEPDDGTDKRRGSLSYHNEDCTVIKAQNGVEWSDVNCNNKNMFICKIPAKGNEVHWRPVYTDTFVKSNAANFITEEMFKPIDSSCSDGSSVGRTEICGSTNTLVNGEGGKSKKH